MVSTKNIQFQKAKVLLGFLLSTLSPRLKQSLVMVITLDWGLIWTFSLVGFTFVIVWQRPRG
jgi:hypothetical protein